MRYCSILLISLWLGSCGGSQSKYPTVEIQTRLGDIVVEIYNDKAPISGNEFLAYVDSGFYENSSFYRVLNHENQPSYSPKSELIQGGIWKSNPRKAAQLAGIPHETTKQTGIQHTDGTVSLARIQPGTANTEFFICIGDQPGFDYGGENNPDGQGYAAFGRVIEGMDVVRQIYQRREYDQAFDPPVPIFNIVKR